MREMKNGNRRSLYVSMTEHGKEMMQDVEETFALVDRQAIKGLSGEEISELMRLLAAVNQNLTVLSEEKRIDKESKTKN